MIATLDELGIKDLVRVLTEPENALTKQFRKMCMFDKVDLKFTDCAIEEIAQLARAKGTGARGLRSVVESLTSDLMFDPPNGSTVTIDKNFVLNRKRVLDLKTGVAA